jgi:hypothetical protein
LPGSPEIDTRPAVAYDPLVTFSSPRPKVFMTASALPNSRRQSILAVPLVCSPLVRLDSSVRGGARDAFADTVGRPIADADAGTGDPTARVGDAVGAR